MALVVLRGGSMKNTAPLIRGCKYYVRKLRTGHWNPYDMYSITLVSFDIRLQIEFHMRNEGPVFLERIFKRIEQYIETC